MQMKTRQTLMNESIETRWRTLLARGDAESREIDAESPLRMLMGVSADGHPYLAVITGSQLPLPELPSAIEVTRRQRSIDARWSLTLKLEAGSLTDAFISLFAELASKSARCPNEETATQMFFETLFEWRDLLTGRVERMSESALRGLVAELWFGFESKAHPHDFAATVRAWAGPFGAAQDFQFLPPGMHHEVKSLRPARTEVEVGSAEQLDDSSLRLEVVTMDEVERAIGGLTLVGLVTSIRGTLRDGADRREFDRRFGILGVDLEDSWYSDHCYCIKRLRTFSVPGDFPALRRSQLPTAITRTTYRIDVNSINRYLIQDSVFTDGGMSGDG
jgi:hypothetical protein